MFSLFVQKFQLTKIKINGTQSKQKFRHSNKVCAYIKQPSILQKDGLFKKKKKTFISYNQLFNSNTLFVKQILKSLQRKNECLMQIKIQRSFLQIIYIKTINKCVYNSKSVLTIL